MDVFSRCDHQNRSILRNWSHLLKKNLSGKLFVQYVSKYLKSNRKIRKRGPVSALFVIHSKTTTKIEFEYC